MGALMPGPGRYHISRKIADGGMAEIFLGRQRGVEGFERPVVLKRILQSLVADPQFRHQMIDEAHVAMSLNHSNIVQVLDLGQMAGRYFLVLELVDGWDLNHIVNRALTAGMALPPEISLYIAGEVCRALGYAHSKTRDGKPLGIVHRDISPHNILVSEHGEVKLTDFGIAKAMGRREHTGHGIIKGKLAYMSPEQASGHEVDGRSDLFSLGTVLYLLATGKRPFEAPTDLEAITRVRQCNFQPPDKVMPGLSREFARVIMRAMQLRAADRYQSAEEMLVDLETVQRRVYRPAGQTELKRWLAELQQRDHAPTISKAAGQPVAQDDSDSVPLADSAELVFDDASQVSGLSQGPRATLPTVAEAPELLPTIHITQPGLIPPLNKPRLPLPRRLKILLGACGVASLMIWLLISGLSRSTAPVRPPLSKPVAASSKPVAATSSASVPARQVQASAPAPSSAPTPKPQPIAEEIRPLTLPDAGDEIRPVVAQAEDEEETLLRHTRPVGADQVVGEDEGDDSAPSNRAKPAPPESVSVRVDSRPSGAVIKLKDRVFGRSPLNLRFRPGHYYELTFVKRGYQTTNKRFKVSNRKNQKVTASLALNRHTAPKKKGILQRIFGRR
jgi:serine/threonine protein kinase